MPYRILQIWTRRPETFFAWFIFWLPFNLFYPILKIVVFGVGFLPAWEVILLTIIEGVVGAGIFAILSNFVLFRFVDRIRSSKGSALLHPGPWYLCPHCKQR